MYMKLVTVLQIYIHLSACFHDSSGSVETFLVLVSLSCSILVFIYLFIHNLKELQL